MGEQAVRLDYGDSGNYFRNHLRERTGTAGRESS